MKEKIKKILKNRIILCTLTAIIFGTIGVSAATYFPSNDVTYDNTESGLSSTNVQEAIDELYNVCSVPPTAGGDLIKDVVTSGDGLYKDPAEEGRYVYRGTNPNNYIKFNDELWRIIAIEKDGPLKIMSTVPEGPMAYDDRTEKRYNSYCNYTSSNGYWGCNSWGNNTDTYNASGKKITSMKVNNQISTLFALPTNKATSNDYLNTNYYQSLTQEAKGLIIPHMFAIGFIPYSQSSTLKDDINYEQQYFWRGNIGLPNITDYIKASTDSGCTNVASGLGADYNPNENTCYNNNFFYQMFRNYSWYSMTYYPAYNDSEHRPTDVYGVIGYDGYGERGEVTRAGVYQDYYYIIPTIYLQSDIQIVDGKGSSSNPYIIS